METSSPYEPLDLNQVLKSLPKSFKKINSDKDLEAEIAEICVTLKDLSKFLYLINFFSHRLEEKARSLSEDPEHFIFVRQSVLW